MHYLTCASAFHLWEHSFQSEFANASGNRAHNDFLEASVHVACCTCALCISHDESSFRSSWEIGSDKVDLSQRAPLTQKSLRVVSEETVLISWNKFTPARVWNSQEGDMHTWPSC